MCEASKDGKGAREGRGATPSDHIGHPRAGHGEDFGIGDLGIM